MTSIHWRWLPFDKLTLRELHDLLALRTAVFVVEQDCPYQEVDGKDEQSWHLLGFENQQLQLYSRVLPPGLSYPEVSLGRVVVDPDKRGQGLGYTLMDETMAKIKEQFGDVSVRISAQEHLQAYYAHYGFQAVGEGYLEDDIPHIQMLYTPVP